MSRLGRMMHVLGQIFVKITKNEPRTISEWPKLTKFEDRRNGNIHENSAKSGRC